MKSLIRLIILCSLFHLTSISAEAEESVRASIENGFNFVKTLPLEPKSLFEFNPPGCSQTATPESRLAKVLHRLQAAYFGQDYYQVRICRDFPDLAQINYSGRLIYVSYDSSNIGIKLRLEEAPESLIAFVLAHEIGHHIHETHVNQKWRSPLGNGSYHLTRSPRSPLQWQYIHGEVDALGIHLMLAAGYSLDDVKKGSALFGELVPKGSFDDRAKIIRAYLDGSSHPQ